MTETIKYDMYGKIKNAKEIAAKALGQVDLGSKVLDVPEVADADLNVETKTASNSSASESAEQPEIKSHVLSKLALKKANAKTEVPVEKLELIEESAPEGTKEVKKIPADTTKAMKAKALIKAKKLMQEKLK